MAPPSFRGDIRNEYYFFTGQFKKQYDLGTELIRKKVKCGSFCQGVDASWFAYYFAQKGRHKQAQTWARKSVLAWNQFLKIRNNYYYPYVNLAFANGILKQFKQIEINLQKAQELSKQHRTYNEFEDVRENLYEK